MFIRLVFSLLWVGVVGFLLVSIILHNRDENRLSYQLKFWIGIGCGFGIASIHYFLWRVIADPLNRIYIISELLLLILLIGWYLYKVRPSKIPISNSSQQLIALKPTWIGTIFSLILFATLFAYIFGSLDRPHGGWDARMIWNLDARFLFRGGAYWQNIFSWELPHPDYPLMVPTNVARVWRVMGQENLFTPAAIGAGFAFSILGLLIGAVRYLKGATSGYIAGLTLLSSAAFHFHAPAQAADMPLSLYFLAVVVLINLFDDSEKKIYLTLGGIYTGLAIWTKNEGWLFLVSLILARCLVLFLSRSTIHLKQEAIAFLSGLLPILSFVLFYKITFSPRNDLIAALGPGTIQNIMDHHRYIELGREFVIQIISLNPKFSTPFVLLPILWLFFGFNRDSIRKPGFLTGLFILPIMLGGYAIIFITTPYSLDWHLYSANARLFLQLWPLAIFVVMMVLSGPMNQPEAK